MKMAESSQAPKAPSFIQQTSTNHLLRARMLRKSASSTVCWQPSDEMDLDASQDGLTIFLLGST